MKRNTVTGYVVGILVALASTLSAQIPYPVNPLVGLFSPNQPGLPTTLMHSPLPWQIQDFGAKCDGATDDSRAFTTALSLVALSPSPNGVVISLPAATCNFSTTLDVQVGVVFQGVPGAASILNYTGTGTAIIWEHATSGASVAQYSFGPGMRDLILQGPGVSGSTVGLQMGNLASRSTQGAYFENVKIVNFNTCFSGNTGFFLSTFNNIGIVACTRLLNLPAAVNNGEGIAFTASTFFNAGTVDSAVFLSAGGGEFSCERCSFDNAQVTVKSGSFYCAQCHFEDPGTAGNYDFVLGTGGAVALVASNFNMDDTTTAGSTITEFVNMAGGGLYAGGNFFSNLGTHNAIALTFGRAFSCGGSAHMLIAGQTFMSNVFTEYLAQGSCTTLDNAMAGGATASPQFSGPSVTASMAGAGSTTPSLATARRFEYTFTGSTATINNPTSFAAPAAGNASDNLVYIELFNNSGGALTITWGTAFLGSAGVTAPGTGKRRMTVWQERSNGTQLILVSENAADI